MQKNAESKQLTQRERAFVELIADYMDSRSVGLKGQQVGWRDAKHAYRVARRPHVAAAIDGAVSAQLRSLRARAARVLSVLADRAKAGDVRAATLFLEAAGVLRGRDLTVTITPQGNPDDAFVARANAVREARGLLLPPE